MQCISLLLHLKPLYVATLRGSPSDGSSTFNFQGNISNCVAKIISLALPVIRHVFKVDPPYNFPNQSHECQNSMSNYLKGDETSVKHYFKMIKVKFWLKTKTDKFHTKSCTNHSCVSAVDTFAHIKESSSIITARQWTHNLLFALLLLLIYAYTPLDYHAVCESLFTTTCVNKSQGFK
jgi:hypothetical protein